MYLFALVELGVVVVILYPLTLLMVLATHRAVGRRSLGYGVLSIFSLAMAVVLIAAFFRSAETILAIGLYYAHATP